MTTDTTDAVAGAKPLNRGSYAAGPAAPVRIVHIGLGAFHRAHQAWYTDQVDSGREWGIAAFTGRSPEAAETLRAQDGLFTLIERAEDGDSFSVIESIVAAHSGADLATLASLVAAPATAIITLTVTEAAYLLGPDGRLDLSAAAVAADVETLRARWAALGSLQPGDGGTDPVTMPARLVLALDARRRAGSGPLAVVSCDNLAANGTAARNAVLGMASAVDAVVADWITGNVSFVDTSIDRITPRTTEADVADVAAATGYADRTPVVTEPFRSWVLSGDFPAGRPAWEQAGAVFVDEIEQFENRKLWLLNGAHSLLAYAGQLRGHTTVAEALADPACAGWIEEFWNAAAEHLTAPGLDVPAYRAALLERFSNPRIAHHLAQIAMDGSNKLRMRAVPVMLAERAQGRSGAAAARMIAAWIEYLASLAPGAEIKDAEPALLRDALAKEGHERTVALLAVVDPEFAADPELVAGVEAQLGTFS